MYKIMIADDEGIVIDALKFIIEKSFGETCQVQSAKTGRSVIELAESFRPDIALMDIQMPGINGIEAMKEIRKTNKDIIFIVITAYDKFDYAREAVGLGVMEYVNKPIDRVKITRLLEQAMERINGERERRSNDLRVKEQLATATPIVESGFIYSVLFRQNYVREVSQFKDLLGVTEDSGFMMVIEYDAQKETGTLSNTVDLSVQMYKNDVRLRETIKEFFPCGHWTTDGEYRDPVCTLCPLPRRTGIRAENSGHPESPPDGEKTPGHCGCQIPCWNRLREKSGRRPYFLYGSGKLLPVFLRKRGACRRPPTVLRL